MKTRPAQFIDEPIQVEFDSPPTFDKKPPCPQRFRWRGQVFTITSVV